MSAKRPPSPGLIPNPFIKKRNLEWTIDSPLDLDIPAASNNTPSDDELPTTAAIESGTVQVQDHLSHFTSQLSKHILPAHPSPLLPISSFAALYTANAGSPEGAHFVIHQHDHPVAGVHYDLRLQINETSSVSWAIMYGLPGDPNSVRLNRNAAETRVHCLWNHLIETASSATGSLLIWDTGTYTIPPRQSKHAPSSDPSSPPSSPPPPLGATAQTLLHAAFQNRQIRLRLHGSKLPDPYVLNLRLTKSEDASGRARSSRTPRTRRRTRASASAAAQPETSSDSDDEAVIGSTEAAAAGEAISAMEREIRELEDEHVRATNAYAGATNTIGSVDQRRWYLSLDRRACGFVERKQKGRSVWEPDPDRPVETFGSAAVEADEPRETKDMLDSSRLQFPFYVRGVEEERSMVTGRKGADVLRDEGVHNFTQRKGWKPVLK
ncbi:hypothetical protein G7046_g5859 [Stylonectria norvegica]|nr:hypothetical protein G7046_g5859 [Stylonectria norvegica]